MSVPINRDMGSFPWPFVAQKHPKGIRELIYLLVEAETAAEIFGGEESRLHFTGNQKPRQVRGTALALRTLLIAPMGPNSAPIRGEKGVLRAN
jgi:hypothetical protein